MSMGMVAEIFCSGTLIVYPWWSLFPWSRPLLRVHPTLLVYHVPQESLKSLIQLPLSERPGSWVSLFVFAALKNKDMWWVTPSRMPSGGVLNSLLLRNDGMVIGIGDGFNRMGHSLAEALHPCVRYKQVSAGYHFCVLLTDGGSVIISLHPVVYQIQKMA